MKTTAPNHLSEERRCGAWLLHTFSFIALIVAVNLIFQWRMDVFGVLRDPHGRSLITSHHEAKAKFLLNKEYVPANFDALIVGASASVNWNLSDFGGFRFYNESVEGGNSSGERLFVEQALPKGHFKVAIVCLYPRITADHILLDGLDMTRPEEAYGSLNAFTIEASVLNSKFHHATPEAYPNGSHRLPEHAMTLLAPDMPKLSIIEDPVAVANYRETIKELMASGTRIVYVMYPLYESYYERNADQIAMFIEAAKQDYPPAPLINLNDPQYVSLRSDPKNWIDEVHLSQVGADTFSPQINLRLQEALRSR